MSFFSRIKGERRSEEGRGRPPRRISGELAYPTGRAGSGGRRHGLRQPETADPATFFSLGTPMSFFFSDQGRKAFRRGTGAATTSDPGRVSLPYKSGRLTGSETRAETAGNRRSSHFFFHRNTYEVFFLESRAINRCSDERRGRAPHHISGELAHPRGRTQAGGRRHGLR